METRAHHILVGLFTLIGGAAILLFTLWLTGSGVNQDTSPYDIVFNETVSGLSVGSAVHYNGIRVGEVESLNLNPEDPRQVWARVSVSASTPIKTDTTASLTLLNITGSSGIALSQGTPESPLLASTATDVPVIIAEPSSFQRLRGNADELLLGVTTLIDSANRVLSEENAANVARMLNNLDSVTTTLAEEQDTLRAGLQSLITAGEDLSRLLTSVESQVSVYGESVLQNTADAMAHIEQLTERLDTLVADNADAVGTGLQSLSELDPVLRELRSTMNRFQDIVSRLEENPSGFLLGGDGIREFEP